VKFDAKFAFDHSPFEGDIVSRREIRRYLKGAYGLSGAALDAATRDFIHYMETEANWSLPINEYHNSSCESDGCCL
jgi:hypothetical protein